jgi:hypothetical protein
MFDALVLSLPTRKSTLRMRAWRALKESGCGVLRDGVYLLPSGADKAGVLAQLETEIRKSGGFAMAIVLKPADDKHLAELRALFDRSGQYGQLVADASKAKARTGLARLQRAYERLAKIDFFPGQAKLQAAHALSSLKASLEAHNEPRPSGRQPRRIRAAAYQGRLWASRHHPWVDRLASAWLIKRFIDRKAKFLWLERPRERPRKAVGFDFDGAEFTHVGNRVTFEALLEAFGLQNDPALGAIAAAVHYLDIGGIPIADAKGLETLLKGAKENARDDDALLGEAMRVFDLFYSAYRSSGAKGGATPSGRGARSTLSTIDTSV